jgi:hypothetical protein
MLTFYALEDEWMTLAAANPRSRHRRDRQMVR